MTTRVRDVDALAAYVRDGHTLAIGGTLFTRMPVALTRAVCAARPRDVHYLSWGGGFPLEMLLEAGVVISATICFSSLDVFGQARRFRAAVEAGDLRLTELTAHALHQGLWAGRRRLPSEPMIWPAATELARLPGFPTAASDPVSGSKIGVVPAIRPDVLLLHARAADRDGNLDIYGARGLDLTAIPASTAVVATVDAVVERAELGALRGSVVVPHHLVTAWALAPGAAYPTSSLPHYTADYEALLEWSTADSIVDGVPDPAPGLGLPTVDVDDLRRELRPVEPTCDPTVDEWMTCVLARQYDNESICSVGAVSPLASASYLLAKATHAPGLTLVTNGGGYVDVALRPLLFGLGEWLDSLTCVAQCGGDEVYELYYHSGRVAYEVVSVAQIDVHGRTNNHTVTSPSGRVVRLPGQGGMADVADMHRHFVIYLPRQSALNTPAAVSFVTAARSLHSDDERTAAGYQPGSVRLVTNLATFALDHTSRRFELESVFPWTTYDELSESTGWDLGLADLQGVPVADAPSPEELTALRNLVDPLGLRRLEFVPSKDRLPLLRELTRRERAVLVALREAGSVA